MTAWTAGLAANLGDGPHLSCMQTLGARLADSIPSGNVPSWGKKGKNRYFSEPVKFNEMKKIPSNKQVLDVSVIGGFLPMSPHRVSVEVAILGGKADTRSLNLRAGSIIIGIFQ